MTLLMTMEAGYKTSIDRSGMCSFSFAEENQNASSVVSFYSLTIMYKPKDLLWFHIMEVSYDWLTKLKFRGHGVGGGGMHFGHSWSEGAGGGVKYGSLLWYGMDIFQNHPLFPGKSFPKEQLLMLANVLEPFTFSKYGSLYFQLIKCCNCTL